MCCAGTEAEVDAALAEMDQAVTDTRERAGDEFAEQVGEHQAFWEGVDEGLANG
jgi:hypothetical protein